MVYLTDEHGNIHGITCSAILRRNITNNWHLINFNVLSIILIHVVTKIYLIDVGMRQYILRDWFTNSSLGASCALSVAGSRAPAMHAAQYSRSCQVICFHVGVWYSLFKEAWARWLSTTRTVTALCSGCTLLLFLSKLYTLMYFDLLGFGANIGEWDS